jgi:hypothetical protein
MTKKYLIWIVAGVLIALASFIFWLGVKKPEMKETRIIENPSKAQEKQADLVVKEQSKGELAGKVNLPTEKPAIESITRGIEIPVKGEVHTVYIIDGEKVAEGTHEIAGTTEIKLDGAELSAETHFDDLSTLAIELPDLQKHNELGIKFDEEFAVYYRYNWDYAWLGVEYGLESKEVRVGAGVCWRF